MTRVNDVHVRAALTSGVLVAVLIIFTGLAFASHGTGAGSCPSLGNCQLYPTGHTLADCYCMTNGRWECHDHTQYDYGCDDGSSGSCESTSTWDDGACRLE